MFKVNCNDIRTVALELLLLPFYSVFLGFSNCKWYLSAVNSFSLHKNPVNKKTFVLLWVVTENLAPSANFLGI